MNLDVPDTLIKIEPTVRTLFLDRRVFLHAPRRNTRVARDTAEARRAHKLFVGIARRANSSGNRLGARGDTLGALANIIVVALKTSVSVR